MAPSSRRAAGAGPRSGKSGKRAPGRRAGRGTSGGARGPRVQLESGLARTKAKADLGAGDAAPLYPGFIPGGSDDLRWATNMKGRTVMEDIVKRSLLCLVSALSVLLTATPAAR